MQRTASTERKKITLLPLPLLLLWLFSLLLLALLFLPSPSHPCLSCRCCGCCGCSRHCCCLLLLPSAAAAAAAASDGSANAVWDAVMPQASAYIVKPLIRSTRPSAGSSRCCERAPTPKAMSAATSAPLAKCITNLPMNSSLTCLTTTLRRSDRS